MKKQIFKNTLKMLAIIIFMPAIICCGSNYKGENKDSVSTISKKEVIPDSVAQFLLTSAANDFRAHQPPTPIDFRNIKIGYIKSPNGEKMFTLCGEFLAKEDKEWVYFTTIKTFGYEHFLGKTQYCHDTTIVLTDESLSVELKNLFFN